ncbi:hypothetical protein A4S06_11625 [Erysipelotrichaceae bacterium MTC7]|nr:hypothetical protein A4S06_11625 [Erysipelotrichaceae bacterium MTC7]
MNEEQLIGYIDEVKRQIPNFVRNKEVLKTHIRFMRMFSDISWWNVASILYNLPSATNVKTKDAWDKEFKEELWVKKGMKGLLTVVPSCTGNTIIWKPVKVFDISQMNTKKKPVFSSLIATYLDPKRIQKLKSIFSEDWHEKLISELFKQYEYEKGKQLSFKDNLMNYLQFGLLDILKTDVDEFLDFENHSEEECVQLYIYLSELFQMLPSVVVNSCVSFDEKERRKKQLEEIEVIKSRNVRETIDAAKEIRNNRLQNYQDSDHVLDVEAKNEDSNGVPMDFMFDDNDVYLGEDTV